MHLRALIFLSLFLHTQLTAVSMVYNFRIAQITREPFSSTSEHRHHRVIALPFEQFYRKYSGNKQNYAGGLAAYIFDFARYYFRADAAVASIRAWDCEGTTFSGKGTDDILFSFGGNFVTTERTIMTLSGLFGIPTHSVQELRHPAFGYGQVGLGLQLDGVYHLGHIQSLIYGARYIYFVPRRALDDACFSHKFSIGNVGDILVATKANWVHHGVEFGYTARFNFGAHCCPRFDDIVAKTNYIRSSLYAVYKYKWRIRGVPNRFLLNFGYGFDHTPKKYGNKYILTLWASWNVNF